MKAILLLAGRSRRFWPLREKNLFPICGKTLLGHQIDRLKRGGIRDITLVGGAHNLEPIRRLFPDVPMVEQKDLTLGMRGALLSALPQCGNGPVLIAGGNDVIDPSGYAAVLEKAARADGAILAKKVVQYFPGGYLSTDGDRITGIAEKPGAGNEPGNLVNIVAHVHNEPASLLEELRRTGPGGDDGYERALAVLFKGKSYVAAPYDGPWSPVKYPWHLLPLLEHLLGSVTGRTIHPSAEIHPSAIIDGPVVIGEGVRVFPHAIVRGPCVIGPRTVIANNALVRGSSIGADCVIGYVTEVKSSILADHVWTHTSYIGESVIGRNVSFGAGCITGNLRLDEAEIDSAVQGEDRKTGLTKFGTVIGDDCRLGIHSGINPGKKIGAGSFVASHALVTEDIPDRSFVRMKDGKLTVSANRATVPHPGERKQYAEKL